MGFFDRVKKAFGGGKPEATPAEKDTEVVASQAEPKADSAAATDQATTTENTASDPMATDSTATTVPATAKTESDHESTTVTDSATSDTATTTSTPKPAADNAATSTAAETATVTSESAPTPAAKVATESSATPATDTPQAESPEPEISAATTDEEATANTAEVKSPVNDKSDAEAAKAETATTTDYDQGLAKSRHGFAARLNEFLAGFRSVDEDFFEDLEEMLIEADVGFETAMTISNQLRDEVKLQNAKTKKQVGLVIVEKMVDLYGEAGAEEDNQLHFAPADAGPTVFLFVGVNGAGKTTTVGKLAAQLKAEGKKVLLAACDTFRAGAIEQLAEWSRRVGVDIVKSEPGADPASVVFEAVKKAKAEDYDVLLVDTAGRLQNKVNLMNELAKMKRVIVRELPAAPQEVLLVLDASTGQNALSQAKQFQETTDVTGIVLTKLDGSSKGGIVIAIRNELHLPVKLVGLGEHVGDLQAFDAEKFVYGLFKGLIDGADD